MPARELTELSNWMPGPTLVRSFQTTPCRHIDRYWMRQLSRLWLRRWTGSSRMTMWWRHVLDSDVTSRDGVHQVRRVQQDADWVVHRGIRCQLNVKIISRATWAHGAALRHEWDHGHEASIVWCAYYTPSCCWY